jgi:hypothetical protein
MEILVVVACALIIGNILWESKDDIPLGCGVLMIIGVIVGWVVLWRIFP